MPEADCGVLVPLLPLMTLLSRPILEIMFTVEVVSSKLWPYHGQDHYRSGILGSWDNVYFRFRSGRFFFLSTATYLARISYFVSYNFSSKVLFKTE